MAFTHHAEYLLPGAFMPEQATRQLERRDPNEAAAAAPHGAYCFKLYDLPTTTAEAPEGFDLRPKRANESKGRYYIGGTVYTLAKVKKMPDMHIMAVNMECNRWPRAIKCRTGNWQPFLAADELVPEPATVSR